MGSVMWNQESGMESAQFDPQAGAATLKINNIEQQEQLHKDSRAREN